MQLPVHAIKEPELADKSFKLPKIPRKTEALPVQLSMAEIVEEADKFAEAIQQNVIDLNPELEKPITSIQVELNTDSIKKAMEMFASKQKVSLVPLIKLLIPEISNKQISLTMTKQQEEFIGGLKVEWQAFLKQYFNDNDITLNFIIDEKAITTRQAYTSSEQFEEMLAEYELFRKMVNQFKLKLKQ